jgi:DNA segregation ATPase FtsK/SpoIIIE and related proteins
MFEPIAYTLIIGDQREELEAGIIDLRAVRREMQRRYVQLREMAKARDPRAPEAKVTRELANDPSMNLHPIVIFIDEVQVAFGKSCEWADEYDEIITDLVKRGPAVGIICNVATQKPDTASLPTGIRDNVGTRFGMRVLTHQSSDMVLGGGMSVQGYKAHLFTRADKGIGYLVGASDAVDAEVVKAFEVNSIAAEVVVARAYELRHAAGTITGAAAGHTPVRSSLLHDVLEVMAGDRQHSDEIAVRLAGLNPDAYGGWNAERLNGALKGQGVDVQKQLKIGRRNTVGVRREAVEAAITARELTN